MQSIQKTVALGLREYKNPIKTIKLQKNIKTQMQELEGKIEFDKGNYHNNNYENLIKSLVDSRQKYTKSNNLEERKQIAQTELKQWGQYIENRKQDIPEDLLITERQVKQLKQIWDLVKERNHKDLKSNLVLELHNEYSKKFKFDILIDPKCLVQMIHPHHGYLNNYPGYFSFDQMVEIYNQKLVATLERQLGQDLLADEISAFVYWSLYDKAQQGSMNTQEFFRFLRIFKFDINTTEQFQQEFRFGLNLHQGEYNQEINSKGDGNYRFDFFRYIFLERNL
ncbi:hypothetical protein PPERSA_04334 [Pseudocohnilembus persalinus]|uniref:Uncharacterized protein n=1 Tax=Pseudocohnilembus persalinus TaxID=266149 RepID=A0A0V0QQW5_PSEPJ|nr:hypothetical protein PPERSA_04334 [Pseudocohnilembus persalinus]|eukprot:KRX04519.1 hypothetical protein PPERSA_04334 [Pseudocohnilembus persalinus]